MQGIKYDQQFIRNDINELKNQFEQYIVRQNVTNRNQHNITHWTEENNITWPLKTKEEYDKLNELLNDEKIRKDFVCYLQLKLIIFCVVLLPFYLLYKISDGYN